MRVIQPAERAARTTRRKLPSLEMAWEKISAQIRLASSQRGIAYQIISIHSHIIICNKLELSDSVVLDIVAFTVN